MAAFENARQLMAYVRSSRHEWKVPEFVMRVALQLHEDNSYAPWMRTMTNKSLENHAHNLLTDFRVLLVHTFRAENMEQGLAEIVRMSVWITDVIGNSIQKLISCFRSESLSLVVQQL